MTPPKVFISYSHDSTAHEAKVLALTDRLRSNGIDAVLDQYESFPSRGWLEWGARQIRDAQFTLMVCTETYGRRWDGEEEAGVGLGATEESHLIRQLLYDARGVNDRFIPVVLKEADVQHIPLGLRRYEHFAPCTEAGYDALYRLLTDQAKVRKPALGHALSLREQKPDFRNLVWNAPPRNPFFTGRAQYLNAIREALTQSAPEPTQPQAISGLGGIGKTQTAIEYAHRYRAQYSAVLWSGADSQSALLSGFATFASLLSLPQKGEPDISVLAAAVRRWLESNSGWLLVLDNVEDLALVTQYVPAGGEGHLLITTRLRATGECAESVDVKKMDPEEGALFLLRRVKFVPKNKGLEAATEADRALALQISVELDGLPLALDQAGAFIEETPSTLMEYFALYRGEGAALRARRGKLAPDHASVTITFSLAFGRLAEANPAAADLLRACAFLAPDAIPEEIFTQAGGAWGERIAESAAKPFTWVETIEDAGRFALIHRDAGDKSIWIHPLVQEVVQDEMDWGERRGWAERVVQALGEVFPKVEFQNWPQCERLLAHANMAARHVEEFKFHSAAATRLLSQSGGYLRDRARYTEADPLLGSALAIREKALGPEHPDTATSLNDLAALYHGQARDAEAEPLLRRALAIRERALGLEHPDTAASLNNLAAHHHSQARYLEAAPLLLRALVVGERSLGLEHPDTARRLNNLALLYDDQGRYAEAEAHCRRALAIRETALGPEHPDTAISLSNLALLNHHLSRYAEAEPLCRKALSIRERALGPEHPDTAISLSNLAVLYGDQGRYAEAEPLYRRALAIFEKAFGPEHPSTATGLHNLAVHYHDQGRYAEAEPLDRRALAIREKALGPGHPGTARSLNLLAEFYGNQGRYAEAEPLNRRALAIFEMALGPEHLDTANSLNSLARLYHDQGHDPEAEPLLRRALAIREKALGPQHPVTATSIRNYAFLLRRLGRFAEAEDLEARLKAAQPQ